jgi:TonB family protein
LFASLGVHLAVVLLFSGVLLPRFQRDLRPVYHVDLVNLPVKNPQAGRPDAQPEPAKAPAKPAAPEPAKPKAKPEAVKVAKPEPVKPAAVKPKKTEAAPVKTSEKKTAAEEAALQERFRQMQARQEREDIKKRLDEMATKDSRQAAAVPNAPVGSLTGKGTEAGTAWDEWLRAFFKSNWSLSKYQVSRPGLEAKVRINYDAQGNLIDYKFLTPSGDTTFDDSVKKAILFDKKLPKQPGERLDIVVVFNLKELLQ